MFGTTIGKNPDQQELRQSWQTPKSLFNQLHAIFHFTVDACASPDNALLPKYWTKETDCLKQEWTKERAFCNPPFQNIAPIIAKASTALVALMVLPLTALTTKYAHAFPPKVILIPNHRIAFNPPKGLEVKIISPSLGTVFLVYGQVPDNLDRLGFLICKRI
jgi:phage N-6-adenine-methyltransferase